MRDMAKKRAHDARRHKERMASDLDYRMKKLLATIRARCDRGKGRNDGQYYGGLPVTLTVNDLKTLWVRDNANKMARPSIDRIENALGYTFTNCRFIEHADNVRRAIELRDARRSEVA